MESGFRDGDRRAVLDFKEQWGRNQGVLMEPLEWTLLIFAFVRRGVVWQIEWPGSDLPFGAK